MELNPKQSAFVDEYLIDLNATQAAIRAGYAKNNAHVTASRLLSNDKIKVELTKRKQLRAERTKVDADYVLHRLSEIDQMDIADILTDSGALKPVSGWPKVWRQYLSGMDVSEMFAGRGGKQELVGVLKKIKWPDKLKNLELIGKHVDVQAWKEKIEHEGEVTARHELSPELMEMIKVV